MVATRRGVRQESTGEGELPAVPPPEVSSELNNPVPQRLRRSRYKESSQSTILFESQLEEPETTATKPQLVDLSEPLNLTLQRTTKSRSKHETQSDGSISEAESNCSSVSSLQISTVTRTTRSRQIKITYSSDSVTKSKTKKAVSRTEPIAESLEEEVSESESCCSSVSGIQITCAPRTTRGRQNMVKIPPALGTEPQIEDISDAESWCSGVSAGLSTRKVTRSSLAKSHPENTNQSQENDNDIFVEEEVFNKSKENGAESQPLIISDSEYKTKSDSSMEQASLVPSAVSCNLRNKAPPPRRIKSRPEHEVEEKIKKDENLSSQTTEKRKQNRVTLLNKDPKDICLDIADNEEEELDQALKWEKSGKDSEFQLVHVDISQPENENKGSLLFQKHSPLKQTKNFSVHQQEDVRTSKTSTCLQTVDLVEEQSTKRRQQNEEILIDDDMDGDCKINTSEADVHVDQRGIRLQSKTKVNTGMTREDCDKRSDISLILRCQDSDTSEEEERDTSNIETSNLKPLLLLSSEDELPHVDGLFVIDKAPGLDSGKQYYLEEEEKREDSEGEEEQPLVLEENEDDFVDEDEDLKLLNSSKPGFVLSTSIDPGFNDKDIGGLYISFDVNKQKPGSGTFKKIKAKKNNTELLQKSILSPDFEKRECVPPYSESVQQQKKKRKEERAKTTGDGWFGMKAPEVTEELKNDLKALKMRSAMDPKRFYKKNDRDGFPKYFQVGTVVDNPIDFYHSRIPKKQRKRTIVEELLADSEFRRYNKKKYQEIMMEKAAVAAGKKNRKKKKFHT